MADAIQDTFVAVWQRPRGFRGDGHIAAWLWGIAIRRLVSRLRTRSSVAAVLEKAGAAPAAEDQVLLSVEYGDIGQALARLSPEMRAVIQAVVLDGRGVAGGRGHQRRGGRGGRLRCRVPGAGGPSSDHVWWIVLAMCVVAIAISIGGRSLSPVDVQCSVIAATTA